MGVTFGKIGTSGGKHYRADQYDVIVGVLVALTAAAVVAAVAVSKARGML